MMAPVDETVASDPGRTLSRQEISDAVAGLGWRYILGLIRSSVAVSSLAKGTEAAGVAVAACGADADRRLWLDLRRDRVIVSAAIGATIRERLHELVSSDRIALARHARESALPHSWDQVASQYLDLLFSLDNSAR